MQSQLDADVIFRSISDEVRPLLDRLDVLASVPSTNTWLSRQCARAPGRFEAVLAEEQTAGRGRQNKSWHSPPRSGLCLSVAYTFAETPANLSCLTLVIGVAIALALERVGARGHGLKWPNDLVTPRGKLGGILTDALTGSDRGITIVTGIGMNVDLTGAEVPGVGLGYAVDDLRSCTDERPSRSAVAGTAVDAIVSAVAQFEAEGLAPYRQAWNNYDSLKGRAVHVEMPDAAVHGVADGIDANGALRVLTERGVRRVYTGSVRLTDEQARPA